MLTFRWKYKKLKQIEGSWNAWDIFTGLHMTRSQAFACVKMASMPKKQRQTFLSSFFFKGQHELKLVNVSFESAFEDLSFQSFLKASD